MGTHLRVLSESYPMNTNMTGLRFPSNFFVSLYFGRNSLSKVRFNPSNAKAILSSTIHKKAKSLDNHLNPVMLVLIG